MKLKMTISEALEFADEWSRGLTLHEGSQGWRVVCMLLAEEVRRLAQVEAEHEALLKAISDAEPVAWISEVQCIGPEYGKKRYEAVPIQSLNPLHYKHTPLYTLNGIKKCS